MSKKLIFIFMVLLFILHQDFWLKDNGTLVFGFIPASLAYHMGFTLMAAFAWFLVVKFAWPQYPEEEEEGIEQ